MNDPDICLLTGCTGVGKTELALRWAEANDAEIISCDSLLFYRGLDIGTAKPSLAERRRVRHHLIDIREPTERMDVKTYVALARHAVADIEGRDKRVLVVGGSGFYLRSFFAPVTDDVPVDQSVRHELERRLQTQGIESLVAELERRNPDGLGDLDRKNPRRVLRALERCMVAGRTLRELTHAFAGQAPPFPGRMIRVVVLAREETELKARIERRTAVMLAQGLVGEVRALRRQGLETNPSASQAIGYREVLAWIDTGADVDALAAAINRNTWRLARKQRTWFRTKLPPSQQMIVLRDDSPIELSGLFAAGA